MGLGSRIRDPGSGKNLFRILDPRVKKSTVSHALSLPPPGIEPGSPPGRGQISPPPPKPAPTQPSQYNKTVSDLDSPNLHLHKTTY